jgi:curved DNA-binding protein CbpA
VQLSLVAMALRTQSPFWALGVEPDASLAEVDRAYETLARRFHADRYRNASEDERRIAREIFERLGQAHRVLREPAGRRAHAHGAKTEKNEEHAEARPPSPRRKSSDSSVSGAISGSFSTGDSLPSAAVRAIYDAGLEHLRARRHHEAVEAFRQAARLAPGEANFRAALGWALFREAPADARAGRAALAELRRALQIDAKNRPAMQYLAQLYEQTSQPELAIKELEKILALDPSASEAADGLRRLRDER